MQPRYAPPKLLDGRALKGLVGSEVGGTRRGSASSVVIGLWRQLRGGTLQAVQVRMAGASGDSPATARKKEKEGESDVGVATLRRSL